MGSCPHNLTPWRALTTWRSGGRVLGLVALALSACTDANPYYVRAVPGDGGPGDQDRPLEPDAASMAPDAAADSPADQPGDLPPELVPVDMLAGEPPSSLPVDAADSRPLDGADAALVDMTADAPAPGRGPIGYWKLDETTGTMATDSSGHGHHGAYEGSQSALWGSGQVGGALRVSGDQDRGVRVARSVAIDGVRQFTVAGWVLRDRTDVPYHSLISRQLDDGDAEVFNLGFADNLLTLYLPQTSGAYLVRDSQPTPFDEWIHVAGTFNGSEARIFRDGREVAVRSIRRTLPASTAPLYLGTNKNATSLNQPLTGWMDELVLYDYALSADAISDLAAGKKPVP